MKKFHFIMTGLMLLFAAQANAQIGSISDLFGNYKFTADVEFTTEGESYRNTLLAESDATLSKGGAYDAQIIGFAGSQVALGIKASDDQLKNNTIEMTNPNSPQLWNNLMLANKNGDDPNGVFNNGNWEAMPYNTEYYTYNPATKEILIPDFTVVKKSGSSVVIIAKYTNVKMAFISSDNSDEEENETPESTFDWAGEYSFKAGNVEVYYQGEGVEFPAEFDLTISYFDGTAYGIPSSYYISSFLGQDIEQMPIDIMIAEDGKSAEMLVGGICGMIEAGKTYYTIYDMNATDTPVLMTLNEDGTISIENFFIKVLNYTDNSETAGAYYQDVVITKKTQNDNENESGIENVVTENETVIYDLSGRRVKAITNAGIYIINGQKHIIR